MLIDTQRDASLPIQILADGSPVEPDAAPTFRLYDGSMGLIASGELTQASSGNITNATNADPSVITSTAHGLGSGTVIQIASVGGATGVNGERTAIRIDANTFSVDVSGSPGVYTSGGTWFVVGLYLLEIDESIRDVLEPGRPYTILIDYEVSSVSKSETIYFNAA